MSNNIGKLTTPSGEGASIELYEDGTYNISGTNSQPLTFKFGKLWDHVTSNGGQEYQLTMGADRKEGAYLSLRTQDESNGEYKGAFFLGAVDVSNNLSSSLRGLPNNSLTWNNKEIEVIEEIYHKSTSTNDCNWYKKYSNGLVEMSGQLNTPSTVAANSNVTVVVTLPFAMKDNNYQPYVQIMSYGSYWTWLRCAIQNITTTSFTVMVYNDGSGTAEPSTWGWRLTGYYK